jgi:hypothetical protein
VCSLFRSADAAALRTVPGPWPSRENEAMRVEFTEAYRNEFDRLLAVAEKAEKALHKAQAEHKSATRALERHIESRHFSHAIA